MHDPNGNKLTGIFNLRYYDMKPMQSIPRLKKKVNRAGLQMNKMPESKGKNERSMSKKDLISMKRRSKRNLSYISWLDNERRMKNLIFP